MGKIVSLNISRKKGVIKKPVNEIKLIEDFGLEGDAHGGNWHRQVSLLAKESIDIMKAHDKKGIIGFGKFAENITTEGIKLHELPIGTQLLIGDTLVEVTQIGKECHHGCAIAQQVGECVMPKQGIFAKVLKGGKIKIDDEIMIQY